MFLYFSSFSYIFLLNGEFPISYFWGEMNRAEASLDERQQHAPEFWAMTRDHEVVSMRYEGRILPASLPHLFQPFRASNP